MRFARNYPHPYSTPTPSPNPLRDVRLGVTDTPRETVDIEVLTSGAAYKTRQYRALLFTKRLPVLVMRLLAAHINGLRIVIGFVDPHPP
uniref:Uncharacterized protein n=1 Tax=Candidatus Kentrum sp. MB TaxID=2138164 RepID=A0A451B8G4_9GAMM|nr:MAG: hypothetical protein BECKMB1821I_GA0114274_10014 [Candidatus Kentron sp. MB]VFK74579.1 MAG: hypothetical protein BECKMB1821H_GA0114242_100670 [Candidatus Kentron sp. MB]